MPQPYRGERPYPGDGWSLRQAAEAHQLVVCRCHLCHKLVRYLAADLLTIFPAERDARLPPFVCSGCGKTEYVHVKLTIPAPGDWGHLQVRRPGPPRVVRSWRWVMLGDD